MPLVPAPPHLPNVYDRHKPLPLSRQGCETPGWRSLGWHWGQVVGWGSLLPALGGSHPACNLPTHRLGKRPELNTLALELVGQFTHYLDGCLFGAVQWESATVLAGARLGTGGVDGVPNECMVLT